MNNMKDRRLRGAVWWVIVALMLAGVAHSQSFALRSSWPPQPSSDTGVKVVIVCDSGPELPPQVNMPLAIPSPAYGQRRPWTISLPQVIRPDIPLNPVLPARSASASLSRSQLLPGHGMSRGCRPMVIMPGLPVR